MMIKCQYFDLTCFPIMEPTQLSGTGKFRIISWALEAVIWIFCGGWSVCCEDFLKTGDWLLGSRRGRGMISSSAALSSLECFLKTDRSGDREYLLDYWQLTVDYYMVGEIWIPWAFRSSAILKAFRHFFWISLSFFLSILIVVCKYCNQN